MAPVLIVLLFLLTLPYQSVCDPTSCDGDDGGIANCCVGDSTTSTCQACKNGYGLVKNACLKCKNPKCAYCNGDTSTCPQSDQYVGDIPHCSVSDFTQCIECDDGYTLSGDSTKCIKCDIKKCFQCSSDGKACDRCAGGYGFITKAKACVACKVSNCESCPKDVSKCASCGYDYAKGIQYGLVGGKCVMCPKNANKCDGNKVTSCVVGFYADTQTNSCKECPSTCSSCSSATKCTYCNSGYTLKGGKCLSSGSDSSALGGKENFESEPVSTESLTKDSNGANVIVLSAALLTLLGMATLS